MNLFWPGNILGTLGCNLKIILVDFIGTNKAGKVDTLMFYEGYVGVEV